MPERKKATQINEPDAVAETGAEHEATSADQNINVIAPAGDLIVDVFDERKHVHYFYRVSSNALKRASSYFERLLLPGRFREGEEVVTLQKNLLSKYATFGDVPSQKLPRIQVSDIGRISKVKSIGALMEDFMSILHDVRGIPANSNRLPITNLANLVVVADRFDAVEHLNAYMHASRTSFPRIKPQSSNPGEEAVRQRILIGLLLNHADLLLVNCAALIQNGSDKWLYDDEQPNTGEEPLWWYLPNGVEEELQFRRDRVLSAFDSLMHHCVEILIRKERSCKLFFDNSLQCDSYQLGELLRFLTRHDLFSLQGGFINAESKDLPRTTKRGKLQDLIDLLKQCPSYQIDRHHTHCGAKKQLTIGLEILQKFTSDQSLGICLECWVSNRDEHAWMKTKPIPMQSPVKILRESVSGSSARYTCSTGHSLARRLYTAAELDWSSPFDQSLPTLSARRLNLSSELGEK